MIRKSRISDAQLNGSARPIRRLFPPRARKLDLGSPLLRLELADRIIRVYFMKPFLFFRKLFFVSGPHSFLVVLDLVGFLLGKTLSHAFFEAALEVLLQLVRILLQDALREGNVGWNVPNRLRLERKIRTLDHAASRAAGYLQQGWRWLREWLIVERRLDPVDSVVYFFPVRCNLFLRVIHPGRFVR